MNMQRREDVRRHDQHNYESLYQRTIMQSPSVFHMTKGSSVVAIDEHEPVKNSLMRQCAAQRMYSNPMLPTSPETPLYSTAHLPSAWRSQSKTPTKQRPKTAVGSREYRKAKEINSVRDELEAFELTNSRHMEWDTLTKAELIDVLQRRGIEIPPVERQTADSTGKLESQKDAQARGHPKKKLLEFVYNAFHGEEGPSLTLGYKIKAGDPQKVAADRKHIDKHVYCRAIVSPTRTINHQVRRKKPPKKKEIVVAQADGFIPKKKKERWVTTDLNLPGAVKVQLHIAEECKVRPMITQLLPIATHSFPFRIPGFRFMPQHALSAAQRLQRAAKEY
jgi:hypothetical protein